MVIFLLKRGGNDFQGVDYEEWRNKCFEEFFSAAKYILFLLTSLLNFIKKNLKVSFF